MKSSHLSFFVLLVLEMVLCGCATVASSPAAAPDDRHRRYHDGERWHELVIALDRLQVERRAAAGGASTVEAYLLRTPVGSAAALDDVARQMLAAQKDIVGISAYVSPSAAAGAQPMRLTHRFSLRGKPGADVERLVAKHGARVVERVDYSTDTIIGEANGPGLFAALDAANALRDEPGVIFAMPLIEHHYSVRDRR